MNICMPVEWWTFCVRAGTEISSKVLPRLGAIRVVLKVMRPTLTETEADRKHSTQTADAKFRL